VIPRLAFTALTRHRARTLLAILGVAVSAAMLLDMVMLSGGMRESFRRLLLTQGFQLRLSPKGTLPFDTEATIGEAGGLVDVLRADPDIAAVSPVLGGQMHVAVGDSSLASVVIGNEPAVQADYEVVAGRAPRSGDEIVASDAFLRAARASVGDTVRGSAGYDPQFRAVTGERRLVVVGRAHFLYMAAGERAVAMPLATLQSMQGQPAADHASVVMVMLRPDADSRVVSGRIASRFPRVSVTSIEGAMRQIDQRLSYFRQLAVILGAVSLVVGFLLVTTIVTVSVNERLGEIIVMRAIGVARHRIVTQIVIEGFAIMVTGALLGLGLGLVTARYLNTILAAFPGLPEAIDFFLFQPRAAWSALGMLTAAGVLAGVYPSWRGASRPIATTLREEGGG
jgi:putative ABC transport system permease protein